MTTVYLWGSPERYGNYRRAVERAGGRIQWGGDPAGCAGLLLPGGGDLEPWRYGQEDRACRNLEPDRDAAELALLAWFTDRRLPVLGICRGLQTVNVFFGGTLRQEVPGHVGGGTEDGRHAVRTAPSLLRLLCGAEAVVNSAHHQAADRLGAGLEAVQWAGDGVVEALRHWTLPVWAVQWHPERLPGDLGPRLFRTFLARCRWEEACREKNGGKGKE